MDSAAATVIEKPLDAEAPTLSAARIVKLKGPDVVGVPVMAPVPESRLSPVGNDPVTDQARGAVPPVAATACEYNVFTVPPGNDEVLIATAGATTMESP